MNISKVAVAGSGVMGAGIAQVAAMAGYEVMMYDLKPEMLEKGLATITKNLNKGIEKGKVTNEQKESALSLIATTDRLEEVKADLIIEAVVERLDVKQGLFKKLEEINGPDTILATNTSSIPVTRIGAALKRPENFLGLHFFNPAHIMKLVEVISGAATSSEVAQAGYDFAERIGKTPAVAKDSSGFIVNRVARHFYVESLKIAEEGVADVETIDGLLQGAGFRMGPFRLMDLIGVETNFSVTKSMFEAFHYDVKFRPSRIQEQKVDAGHFGRKSGRGFYNYEK
ncbi:3-hydroxyacyl-CoA dehydrogenase family protein [Roseivirga sp. BDSF3-8]|uniref:3-hydroxyacyl-CoA dehydrogenase family protein n=1 Tax=Roseivirga sp. BDSF3-8 TaxID=3241598 RepID=UPI003531CF42